MPTTSASFSSALICGAISGTQSPPVRPTILRSRSAPGFHLRQVLDRESVAPHEALCVGDAAVEVEMAQRQQVPVVIVLTGHLDERQARDLNVRAVLRSVADLPAWIAGTFREG